MAIGKYQMQMQEEAKIKQIVGDCRSHRTEVQFYNFISSFGIEIVCR